MKIASPFNPEHFITMPDEWKGEHAQRHDDAAEKATAAKLPRTWREFAVAMALLDDWNLPGVNGNPDRWDFAAISLPIMAWGKLPTLDADNANLIIPNNS